MRDYIWKGTVDITQYLARSPSTIFKDSQCCSALDFAAEIMKYKGNNKAAMILAWELIAVLISNEGKLVETIFDPTDEVMRETYKEAQHLIFRIVPVKRIEYHLLVSAWEIEKDAIWSQYDESKAQEYRKKVLRLTKWILKNLDKENTAESQKIKIILNQYKINIISDDEYKRNRGVYEWVKK